MKARNKSWLQLLQFFSFIIIAATASAQLRADFTATPLSGCPPMVVSFKDSSSGNPTSWQWDLGLGSQVSVQNPVATYFNPGTYTIKLVVKNAGGTDSIVKTQFIKVNALPIANFKVSDSSGCFPLRVQFSNSSTAGSGTISTYQWDFGDGTLSFLQNPVHTYTSAGSFTVTLRVTNSNGCSKVITKPNYIKLFNGVQADFAINAAASCQSPTPVSFTNNSTGTGILTYLWNFGDGSTSTLQSPTHNYTTAGIYTVQLIVRNSLGCSDTLIKPNAINIGFAKASFTMPDSACVNADVSFINTSTPIASAATWYFSDGTTSTTASPKKAFTTAGIYQVKMVNDFGACLDSVTKSIKIIAKPVASYTVVNNLTCKVPAAVSFTNTSTGSVSVKWLFGDGTTSTQPNPVHTYTNKGNYTVTLIATNASGCSDTLVNSNAVKITPPVISSLNNLNVKGCIPLLVSPTATITTAQPIVSYLWDFGDGFTSTLDSPSHTYTVPGNYSVKLIVTTASGCQDSTQLTAAVVVGKKPVANFSATPVDACAFKQITFTDSSSNGPNHQWFWSFGDGGNSTDQNPKYSYSDTGFFNVTLVVFNFGCSDTLKKIDYIHISPPLANFDTGYVCSDRLTRSFKDKSVGATSWSWDFGDGTTSTLQNPTHTYAAPGDYIVIQRVTNGVCDNEAKKTIKVINIQGPVVVSDSVGCRNTNIGFTVPNALNANVQVFSWYVQGLGGPVRNTTINQISTTYSTAGNYNMAVIVKDLFNCIDTFYTAVPIKVYGPKTDFSGAPLGTCLGNAINFTDLSVADGTHPIVEWTMNYGDGTVQSYNAPPFSYTYTAAGVYGVKLVTKDSYGCTDSTFKPALITISKPIAGFTVSDTLVCPSSTVAITNTSSGGVGDAYTWDFGDGATSTSANPLSHTYNIQGSHVVKMLMVDQFGCSDSASQTIHVYNPVASFAMSDSFSSCPPLLVNFTNNSTSYVQLNWDFGDGGNSQLQNPSHMYTYPGIYKVKLTVLNNGGCLDTLTRLITIQGPTGVFTYNPLKICEDGKIDFVANTQNTVSYIWDYSDGVTIFSNQPTSSHYYTNAGTYVPKIILEDASGCRVPIIGLDTIEVKGVKTNILAQNRLLCDSGYVGFTDSTLSNDVVSGYLWNFGDGTTATGNTQNHLYTAPGWYTVTLVTTTQFGCADTAVYNNYIKIVNSPSVTILGDTSACEPATLTFTGAFLKSDSSTVSWNWTFGNGQTSADQNPTAQLYASAGSYPVQVIVTNSDGCATTANRTAVIHPMPVVDAGIDTTICKFTNYTLLSTGAATYTWSSNPSLSCINCSSPVATPLTDQTYYVTGTTVFGCTNKDTVTVRVKQPFKIAVIKGDTLCVGESKLLNVSGAESYTWTPAGSLNNANIASPKATPDTTTTYMAVGHDDHNCFTDTGYVRIKVYPIPTIDITNGDEITLNVGSTVKLNTVSSWDVTSWRWTQGLGLSCVTCREPDASPKETITYSVVASNDGRCVARDRITVNVICNNANIYVPNTFSPNNDGMNDVFYPRGTGVFSIKNMRVFNRWGQLLFEKNNITANNAALGWDGTSNGIKMQPDVYVYIMEVVCENNTIFPIKGNVSLIR